MKTKMLGLAALLPVALASTASAAIDITEVTAGITAAEGTATTLGAAALGLAVIFMGYKLVRKAIAKV